MSLVFPRDMPCPVTGDVVFEQQFMNSRALPGGGSPQVVNLGPTLWRGRWTVSAVRGGEIEAWHAWSASLRAGLRLFKGRPKRRWPITRPRGFAGLTVAAAPWTGSGVLASIGGDRDAVTVSGLPAGLVLSVGDFLSLPVGPRQHLHEITEAGPVVAGVAAVSIEPPLHVSAGTGAAVLFEGPWCDMALTEAPKRSISLATGVVTFEGLQVLI